MLKKVAKKLAKQIPINFTKNQKYDAQTNRVIKRVCKTDSNTLDIGAHKGEVLDQILKAAPQGRHYAFEPIPDLFKGLVQKYAEEKTVHVKELALSNKKGQVSFNYVISNPAYSGLVKRKYDKKDEVDELITVQTDLLDNIIPPDQRIDFIKIDVEGGEMLVLEGGKETIKRNKPVIIFEHGLGASDFYGATPEKLFHLLDSCGLKISTMQSWLKGKSPFSLKEFSDSYHSKKDFYFIAYP
jgi:FkbM family methyltransferase